MLNSWTVENVQALDRYWEVYKMGLAFGETTEDTDNLPGDDALLLICYTLCKAYFLSSEILSNRADNRENGLFTTSCHLSGIWH